MPQQFLMGTIRGAILQSARSSMDQVSNINHCFVLNGVGRVINYLNILFIYLDFPKGYTISIS